jgi:exonuclease VII large subunit
MQSAKRWHSGIVIACVVLVLVAAGLGWTVWQYKVESARLTAKQQTFEAAKAALDRSQEQLNKTAEEADQQTRALRDAVDKSERYQKEQLEKSTRGRNVANGMVAASSVKVALNEFYLTEGRWPEHNLAAGLPTPESFRSNGVHSVTVLLNGKVKVVVDDQGKRADILLTAVVNGASQVNWRCTSAMTDIAQLLPGCTYKQ